MGDIGIERREVEFEPLPDSAPQQEPRRAPAEPAREPVRREPAEPARTAR